MAVDKNNNEVNVGDKVVFAYQAYSSGYIEIRTGIVEKVTQCYAYVEGTTKRIGKDRMLKVDTL